MLLIGRFVRFLIAVVFFAFGYAVAQFANGNREMISISITPYSFQVPVYLLALVPLAAGLLLGWLYTIPARTHEFADHWRSWKAVRRMEKENKELRRSLDKVLDLPEDGVVAAQLEGKKREKLADLPALEAPLEAEPVIVHEVKDTGESRRPSRGSSKKAAKPASRPRKPERAKLVAAARPVKANGRAPAHPQPEAAAS